MPTLAVGMFLRFRKRAGRPPPQGAIFWGRGAKGGNFASPYAAPRRRLRGFFAGS